MSLVVAAVVAALILVNALYVAAEFSAVSVRRSRLQQMAEEGDRLAARMLAVLNDGVALDRYIAACQVGITISSLVLGAYAQATLAVDLAPMFARLGDLQEATAESVAAAVVLVLLTVLQMVIGELVPKSLALQFPTKVSRLTVLPLLLSLKLMRWPISLLNGSGAAILRALRMPTHGHAHIHSPTEIEYLIAESREGGQLDPQESQRLREALRLGMRTVGELMVPRTRVVGIADDTTWPEVVEVLRRTPFSRLPVYEETLDHVVGVLHVRDVVRRLIDGAEPPASLRDVITPVLVVPETMAVDRLLERLRAERKALAIVADEFGGTAGLITVGDLLDELLGETGDEFKPKENAPQRLADGRVRLPGALRLDEATPWVGVHWEADAYTVGGLVMERLGRLPVAGDALEVDGVRIEVEALRGRAVEWLVVTPKRAEARDA
ncbi:hemolysin family protein [Pseudogemmatithrix spongiicola]|uniref:Hemolysin family protein n=1 Tax=Pseudogemmatithrix spongiicola TaxID=3062599 RepID=A0AA49K188_9BACT|nr:hemolysin family protein [Gemmatimonadaceae bacterium 'strain 138']WKW15563.1 hemolysin family protein [Gemmatimonadaceae bacterium 'strain 318']